MIEFVVSIDTLHFQMKVNEVDFLTLLGEPHIWVAGV